MELRQSLSSDLSGFATMQIPVACDPDWRNGSESVQGEAASTDQARVAAIISTQAKM